MELPLGDDPRSAVLRRLQALLVQRFGHIERAAAAWRQPEWVLAQGVIGARTKSEVSNAAADRLLRKWGSWEAVAGAPVEALQAERRAEMAEMEEILSELKPLLAADAR